MALLSLSRLYLQKFPATFMNVGWFLLEAVRYSVGWMTSFGNRQNFQFESPTNRDTQSSEDWLKCLMSHKYCGGSISVSRAWFWNRTPGQVLNKEGSGQEQSAGAGAVGR